ncbi:MAG: EAL domain-containing protein [Acidocella sp.]|nr:EAL domain-containing protein [Acidocella sp.]
MSRRILTVAAPKWQSALQAAVAAGGKPNFIDAQTAADAVITLATNPAAYHALALDASACGVWFDTLVDLTLGDTERSVSLLMLGSQPTTDARLEGTARLDWPVDQSSFADALEQAGRNIGKTQTSLRPEAFSQVETIRVRYQPVVRFRDMHPTSVEVLARVATKDGAIIGPGAIIAAMSSGEHSMWLSAFIMQLALRERSDGAFDHLDTRFAFNLPLDALLHPHLPILLETIRQTAGIPAKILSFELTETQPVTDLPELAGVMLKMCKSGFRLALDDITPKTPNLLNLLDLPFRCVKLDRSVVVNAQTDDPAISQPARDFILMVTANARKTHRAVIAEGIETQKTMQLLHELGVTHGQGFYFARPLPASALKAWLTHWNSATGAASQ